MYNCEFDFFVWDFASRRINERRGIFVMIDYDF